MVTMPQIKPTTSRTLFRAAIAFTSSLLIIPGSQAVPTCVVQMARVNDPNPPLNVRSSPQVQSNNVVSSLKNGTYVSVISEKAGWFQIQTPTKGWISKTRTQYGCNQKSADLSLASQTRPLVVRDRFIGTGTHQYRFSGTQGQTLTLIRQKGPLPNLIAPQGQFLAIEDDRESVTSWSGKLPATGSYSLQLDSNFRGYDYRFSVQLR